MSRLPTILLILLCSWMVLAVFLHLDDMSVEIYDEARRAVSASEMAAGNANWLVPTYNGHPDHWGTKPALLVLCQAFWMKIFGVGELAVRLPSALATLALCALLIWWGKRDWSGALAGAMAGLFLLCNWQFMGNHGARTGDFDALLTLFLTAQVAFFYRWVTDDKIRWLWLAGLAVLLAGLTKGVAGGFFLPGIGIWLLVTPDGRKRLFRPALYGIIGGAILGVLGYYFLRNTVDPLYLEMVRTNELGGRFASTNEGHRHSSWYYVENLIKDPASGHILAILVPSLLFFFWKNKGAAAGAKTVGKSGDGTAAIPSTPEKKPTATYGGSSPALLVTIVLLVFMLVISIAATKLYWYKTPALPLLGMLIGGFLYRIAELLSERLGGSFGRLVTVALLSALFIAPMVKITERVVRPRTYQETPKRKLGYRDFMRERQVQPPYTVLVRDYHPNARFYVNQAVSRGEDVKLKRIKKLLPPLVYEAEPPGGLVVGERVVICHTETWDYVFKRFQLKQKHKNKGCQLVELTALRE